MSDDLRIRLEGHLEVLEAALALLGELTHCANRRWYANVPVLLKLLEAWRLDGQQRNAAREAAHRAEGAQGLLQQLKTASARLCARLNHVLANTACVRAKGLDAKLLVWAELARTVTDFETGEELASGEATERSWEWLFSVAGAAAVVAMGEPLLVFLQLSLGFVWWTFSQRTYTWRVCRDCIEVDELTSGEPAHIIPIGTIQSIEHVGERVKVRGLWDVALQGASLLEFAVKAQQLHAEVQARAKFRNASEPALWLEASLQSTDGQTRTANGFVLVCSAGLAWVPTLQLRNVWQAVVEAPPADDTAYLAGALRTLPARLLELRLPAVLEVRGVVRLDHYPDHAWQSLGDILLVTLDEDSRLFITCAASLQERLTQIREARK